jgi:hypothetical protein
VQSPLLFGQLEHDAQRNVRVLIGKRLKSILRDAFERRFGQALDGVGLLAEEEALDAAELAGQEQDDALPTPVFEDARSAEPPCPHPVNEVVSLADPEDMLPATAKQLVARHGREDHRFAPSKPVVLFGPMERIAGHSSGRWRIP